MSIGLRISAVVTTILVAASLAGYLWLNFTGPWPEGGAYLVVFLFWSLLTMLATIPSSLITLGIWLGKRNRTSRDDQSLGL